VPRVVKGRCQFQRWRSSSQLLWARSGFLDATIIGLPWLLSCCSLARLFFIL
jgi:hypothetical protein